MDRGMVGGLLAGLLAGVLGAAVLVYLAGPDPAGSATPAQAPARTAAPAGRVPAAAEPARVVSHVDGDTIRVAGQEGAVLLSEPVTTVRLLQVDTPEHARDGRPAECFAAEASDALARLLPVGARLWVERDQELYDRYGRTLLYLWTADGDFVNLELVRAGYGRAVLFEPNDEHIDRMRRAEADARAAGRGLWGACGR